MLELYVYRVEISTIKPTIMSYLGVNVPNTNVASAKGW